MICLETSFLVDYRDGEPYTAAFLNRDPKRRQELALPAPGQFELYFGAVISNNETIEDVADAIAWLDVVPFDEDGAEEAARIRATLRDSGEPIGPLDTLIAGTARSQSAPLVTRDSDFENVPDLAIIDPDPE